MFGYIEGEIFDLAGNKAIVRVSGIGFMINTTISIAQKLKKGQKMGFWTHTGVRENSIDLYGFETKEELNIFEMLITVSGVGPKSALSIISIAGIRSIEEAVINKNTSSLVKISGIGRKTAEKIVLELSGKFGNIERGGIKTDDLDVFDALKSLGYKEKDIQEIIKSLPDDISGVDKKIKYALKNLTK